MFIFVDDVPAIGRPLSAAQVFPGAVPEENMETGAVCPDLVDRDRAATGRPDCEHGALSVRGDTRLYGHTVDTELLARVGAVFLGHINVVSQAEEDASIRE